MRRLALPLALLLVLAGCSGPTGQSQGTPPQDVTPAPVPTGDGSGAERLAPGLTADGVVDPDALASAHERALADRSYVLRLDATGRYRDGTAFLRYGTVARFGADGRYLVVDEYGEPLSPRRDGDLTRTAIWGNESLHVRRDVYANGTSRTRVRPGRSPHSFDHLGRSLVGSLARANATLAGENASGGTTAYLYTATDAPGRVVPYGTRLRDARGRLRAVVTADGFVRSLSGRATGSHERTAEPAQIRFSLLYEAVGGTVVGQPDWATAALANHTGTPTLRDTNTARAGAATSATRATVTRSTWNLAV